MRCASSRSAPHIPSVATLKGLGSLPTDAPGFLGMLGMHGSRAANTAIDECDLLICVGARFDDRATGKIDTFAPRARIIHIDGDPAEIGKLKRPEVGIAGDLTRRARPADRACPPTSRDWRARCADHARALGARPTTRPAPASTRRRC